MVATAAPAVLMPMAAATALGCHMPYEVTACLLLVPVVIVVGLRGTASAKPYIPHNRYGDRYITWVIWMVTEHDVNHVFRDGGCLAGPDV